MTLFTRDRRLETLAMGLPLATWRTRTVVFFCLRDSHVIFRLGSLAWDLAFGNFRLVTLAWNLTLGTVTEECALRVSRLGTSALEI